MEKQTSSRLRSAAAGGAAGLANGFFGGGGGMILVPLLTRFRRETPFWLDADWAPTPLRKAG